MKRYILNYEGRDTTGAFEIYPKINPSEIKTRETLTRNESYFVKFMAEDTSFKGMFLSYGSSSTLPSEIHTICDMHAWVEVRVD